MASRMVQYDRTIREVDLGRRPSADAFRAIIADLDRRVAAAEILSVDATAAIDEVRSRGLAIVAEAIEPIVTDAQALLDQLQNQGLDAAMVALEAIEDLPGVADAQAALEALAGGLTGLAGSLDDLSGVVDGKAAASHSHPTSEVTGLDTALAGKAASSHGHSIATPSVGGFMSAADKSKLDGVAAGANAYTHPTGDGNRHVPATGTSNDGKFLKAGATAASEAWAALQAADVPGLAALLTALGFAMRLRVYTSSTTWNRPTGCVFVLAVVVGGGGGGGGAGAFANKAGSGGGAGGLVMMGLDVRAVASATITIGSGGIGGLPGTNVAGTGGASSWVGGPNTLTANGGAGGANDNGAVPLDGGAGGGASGGLLNLPGGNGGVSFASVLPVSGAGGDAPLGMGAGGVWRIAQTWAGGRDGQGYGSGGSGGVNNSNTSPTPGGDGRQGVVFILEAYGVPS